MECFVGFESLVGGVNRVFGSYNNLRRTIRKQFSALVVVGVVDEFFVDLFGLEGMLGHMVPDFLMLKESAKKEIVVFF